MTDLQRMVNAIREMNGQSPLYAEAQTTPGHVIRFGQAASTGNRHVRSKGNGENAKPPATRGHDGRWHTEPS
jgi:hypothetical protein